MNYNVTTYRIHCALRLSEHPLVHRQNHFNITYLYHIDNDLICDMWKYIRNYSLFFGYQPFDNQIC
jgi:hypothetical protein